MTVIAAIPTRDAVFIAADTQLSRNDCRIGHVQKILTKKAGEREALLAVTGNHRLSALARHSLDLPDAPDPSDADRCDAWAYAVACALAELAALAKPPVLDEERSLDGEALLAYERHLWLLNGQSAVRMADGCAIGCAAPEARGALYAIGQFPELSDPAWSVVVAVKAAMALDTHCGGEIHVHTTRSGASTKIDRGGDPLPGPH